jgi:antitoxin YefM
MDSREFEAMQEKIELLTDIHTAVNQLAAGEGIDQDEAKANVLKRIQNGKQILPVDEILNKNNLF